MRAGTTCKSKNRSAVIRFPNDPVQNLKLDRNAGHCCAQMNKTTFVSSEADDAAIITAAAGFMYSLSSTQASWTLAIPSCSPSRASHFDCDNVIGAEYPWSAGIDGCLNSLNNCWAVRIHRRSLFFITRTWLQTQPGRSISEAYHVFISA